MSHARGRSPRQRLRRGVHVTRNHTRWAARGHMTAACGHLLDGVRGRSRRAKPEGFSAPRGLCWDRSSGLGWPSACRRRPARETVSGRGPSRTMRATEDASAVRSAREVLWENLHFSGKLQTMLSSKGCKNVFFKNFSRSVESSVNATCTSSPFLTSLPPFWSGITKAECALCTRRAMQTLEGKLSLARSKKEVAQESSGRRAEQNQTGKPGCVRCSFSSHCTDANARQAVMVLPGYW